MTTTDIFLKKPYYYNSIEEYNGYTKEHPKENGGSQTNPRYKNFYQTIFHAGDIQQFEEYSYYPDKGELSLVKDKNDVSPNKSERVSPKNITHEIYSIEPHILYKDISSIDIFNTFRYIFYKFKKGIYVKIRDNKLKVFLPFSNANYTNEWGKYIHLPGNDFFEKVSKNEGRHFNPKKINKNKDNWYANNFLLRTEFPINEGDTGICQYRYILEELCKTRRVPDIDFYINRRDFPLLKKDLTEPYEDIYGPNTELVSYRYPKYCPIFSSTTTESHADIPFPTSDDISRVSRKYFKKDKSSYPDKFLTKWKDKIPKAVFRGSSTGRGVTVEDNPRLKLASMMKEYSDFLDVGITKWNCRPRRYYNDPELKTINVSELPFGLSNKMDYISQSGYKYLINVDGHSSAYRLSIEMNMGCVILMVDSKYNIWFRKYLKPYREFIPIKSDLSDLIEKIEWCRTNDEECRKISLRARNFYRKYLSLDGVLDYIQYSLIKTRSVMGDYSFPECPQIKQLSLQREIIEKNSLKLRKLYLVDYLNFCLKKGHTLPSGDISHDVMRILISLNPGNKVLVKGNPYFSNKNSNIIRYTILGKEIICKECIEPPIHEAFVGLYGINRVLEDIPNFSYTYGISSTNLFRENILGETFFEYLTHDKNVDTSFILSIFIQVLLAIQIAQDKCGFIHYDLYPWNIILKNTEEKGEIMYPISPTEIYMVKSKVIPVIIDFNKSSFVYTNGKKGNGIYHGNINPYKASFFQDPLTLLVSLGNILLTKKFLSKENLNIISRIMSFISCSEFYPERRITIPNLKEFLNKAHKYDNIFNCNKGRLWKIRPIELIRHILSIFPIEDITLINGKENSVLIKDEFFLSSRFPQGSSLSSPIYDIVRLFNPGVSPKNLIEDIFKNVVIKEIEYKMGNKTNKVSIYLFYQTIWKRYGKILTENGMENILDEYFTGSVSLNISPNTPLSIITEGSYINSETVTHEGFNKEIYLNKEEVPFPVKMNVTLEYRDILLKLLINNGRYKLLENDRKKIEELYNSYNWEEIIDKYRFNAMLRNINKI